MKIELNKDELKDIITMYETIISDLNRLKERMSDEKSISNTNEVISKKTETLEYLKSELNK